MQAQLFPSAPVQALLPPVVLPSRLVLPVSFCSFHKILDSMLSALVETAKLLAAEHTRADESRTTHLIDGRKDVKELVDRNAHRVQAPAGHAPRSRGGGHGDAVSEVRLSYFFVK